MSYLSAHNHTEYSNLKLIDSINRASELIDYAWELGLTGVAITDHDCLSGGVKSLEYYKGFLQKKAQEKELPQELSCAEIAKELNFKFVLGNEIYLTREGLTAENYEVGEKFYHLILLAKDAEGHRQLRQISSEAWKRAFMRAILRTPTYPSDLFNFVKGQHLIASTACLGGYTAEMWKMFTYTKEQLYIDKMDNFVSMLNELFGANHFYIEIQPSKQEEQIAYNKFMIERYWGKIPFIFTTDSHYLKEEDKEIHTNFLNSKSSKDRETESFYASAYMMSAEEVWSYFKDYITEEQFNAMIANSNKIAQMCSFYELQQEQVVPIVEYDPVEDGREVFEQLDIDTYPTIHYFLTTEDEADNYFMQLIANGYINKYNDKWDHDKYFAEIENELYVIDKIGKRIGKSLSNYFITMAKMIDIIWDKADSIVGPSRGSAGAMLINYLIGITQMNPLEQELELPFWRFLNEDRADMPDIDIDTESFKRQKVFNKVQEYFRSIGGDLVNICTFGTEGTKSALKTAARGLDIDDDVINYLTSMIPNDRGFDWTLSQCYNGDEEHPKITAFKATMDEYPGLWKLANKIEGLVTRLGVHASGVVAVNGDFTNYNSFMKTSKGVLVSAFELHDSEKMGLIKYDFLTVSALDRIRQTINYLLEDKQIVWKGSLRLTYDKYFHPDVLDYTDPRMWDMVGEGKISSLFQFDTLQGSQAILKIKPRSLTQLAIANSVLRLMCEGETPLDTYAKYKNNIGLWYKELDAYHFTPEEIKILEKHLLKLSGVADSQESIMMISMDPQISNFTMAEANKLRKTIAKKAFRDIETMKELFFTKGEEAGTSLNLLSYIWYVQVSRQLGYSFSSIHTTGYSILAVQEMNLACKYPIIYWNAACLCVDSSAINDEDFETLVMEGVVEVSEEEDKKVQNKMSYSKMASAVDKFRHTINIKLPDINESRLGFTPNVEDNSILYGLKGICKITDPVIQEIVMNRPYTSLNDFLSKVTKKVCTKDKVINLIKCGAFNAIENKSTREVLEKFLQITADQKKKLNMQNAGMLINYGLIPEELSEQILYFKLTKELRKHKDGSNLYFILNDVIVDEKDKKDWLDAINKNITIEYLNVDGRENVGVIDQEKWLKRVYEPKMLFLKTYISSNQEELLEKLNRKLFEDEMAKYGGDQDELSWELDSVNFYHTAHPLSKVIPQLPIITTPVSSIREGEVEGYFTIKGKTIPKMKIYSIAGTVLDKDKTKGIVTIQTPDGVVDIKIYKDLFATFVKVLKDDCDNILEDSFFEKGTHLLVTGIKRGTTFVPKVYKSMNMKTILKIELDEDGNFKDLVAKGE